MTGTHAEPHLAICRYPIAADSGNGLSSQRDGMVGDGLSSHVPQSVRALDTLSLIPTRPVS